MPTPSQPQQPRTAAKLFPRYHQLLRRNVRAAVNTSEENIEDACMFAWSKLLSRDLERIEAAYSWLTTVAIREALRLKRRSLQTSSLVTRDDEFIDLADPNDQLQLARTLVDAGEVVRAARAVAAPEKGHRPAGARVQL